MLQLAFLTPGNLIIIFIVALLLFGPERMPEIARQLGRAVREIRKLSGDFTESIMNIRDDVAQTANPVKEIIASAQEKIGSEIDSAVKAAPALPPPEEPKTQEPAERAAEAVRPIEQVETKEKIK